MDAAMPSSTLMLLNGLGRSAARLYATIPLMALVIAGTRAAMDAPSTGANTCMGMLTVPSITKGTATSAVTCCMGMARIGWNIAASTCCIGMFTTAVISGRTP